MCPAKCPFQSWRRRTDGLLVPSPGIVASGWACIATSTLSSGDGTFSFDDIPQTFKALMLHGSLRSDLAATLDTVSIRCNDDNNAHYNNIFGYFYGVGNATSDAGQDDTEATVATCEGANAIANAFAPFDTYIPNYADTNMDTQMHGRGAAFQDETDTDDFFVLVAASKWQDTDAVTSLDVFPTNGTNFKQYSSVHLYGML